MTNARFVCHQTRLFGNQYEPKLLRSHKTEDVLILYVFTGRWSEMGF